jgi:hypothetical protein
MLRVLLLVLFTIPANALAPPPCSSAPVPQPAYFAVAYQGSVSGCTQVSGACLPGEPVTFTALTLVDYTGCPLGYSWNFGDGSPVNGGTATTIVHAYAAGGTYNAQLTITTAVSQQTSVAQAVAVASTVPMLSYGVLAALAIVLIGLALLRLG